MKNILTRYKLVPLAKLTSLDGKDLVQIYKSRWWVVDENENVLFYNGYSPQCNSCKTIVESLRDKLYDGLEVRFVEVAYIPIKSNDFDYDIVKIQLP